MRITEGYRQENAKQHEMGNGYGCNGHQHLPEVLAVAHNYGCATILDYGCGQGTMERHARRVSPLEFRSYDPSVPQFAAEPAEADLVVCCDVMEHVEAHCLHPVIQHIGELANKAVYFQIACRPAKRILSDGRNAHLLIRKPPFWYETLRDYFDIVEFRARPGHSVCIIGLREGSVWT